MPNYLGRADPLALGIDPKTVERLLRDAPLTGHDGEPVVWSEDVADLVGLVEREDR